MAESKGFITLDRNVVESWLWGDAEYLRAWLKLLFLATYQPAGRTVRRQGQVLRLARGELAASQRDLAAELGLSRQRVRTFLGQLSKAGAISTHRATHQITLVRVLNYDDYQLEPKSQPTKQPNANPPPTHPLYKKECNTGKSTALSSDNGQGKEGTDPVAFATWREALEAIEGRLDPHSFNTWFRPTCGVGYDGTCLVVEVPNDVFADWLGEHYRDVVSDALDEGIDDVRFEVRS